MPMVDCMIEKVAQYSFFSTLNLKSAYHQIQNKKNKNIFNALEAWEILCQFRSSSS